MERALLRLEEAAALADVRGLEVDHRHKLAHKRARRIVHAEVVEAVLREVVHRAALVEGHSARVGCKERDGAAWREVARSRHHAYVLSVGGAGERARVRHDRVVHARLGLERGSAKSAVAVEAQIAAQDEGGERVRLRAGAARAVEALVVAQRSEQYLQLEHVGAERIVQRIDPLSATALHPVEPRISRGNIGVRRLGAAHDRGRTQKRALQKRANLSHGNHSFLFEAK